MRAVSVAPEGEAVILEPVKEPTWPDGYWDWVDDHQAELELGRVEELRGGLLPLDLEEP